MEATGRDAVASSAKRSRMDRPVPFLIVSVAAMLLSAACARPSLHYETFTSQPVPLEKRFGPGLACYVREQGKYGVATYSIHDIGRATVPKLTADEAGMLARIQRYVKSCNLRFAYTGTEFIVFNASDGPCVGEYRVLNGSCNEGFDGLDKLEGTTAFPGPCRNTSRPWMPHDTQEGKVPWPTAFGVEPA